MQKQIIKSFFLLTIFFVVPNFSRAAAPSISSATISAGILNIAGADFGIKTQAAPVYWNNMEDNVIGANLPGWEIVSQPAAIVSDAYRWSGNKSLYFPMKTINSSPGWSQARKDLGTGSSRWYFSSKVRFNKNDNNSRFQWKMWRWSSSQDSYAWCTEADTGVFMNDIFWYSSGPERWTGGSGGASFNEGVAGCNLNGADPKSINFENIMPQVSSVGGESVYASYISTNAFVFNKWMNLEQYIQASSVGYATDGLNRMWRDGVLVENSSHLITRGNQTKPWRYFMFGQDINNTLPVAGEMDVDIYYDDIYLDNTQARVEICDFASWTARNHCEIQPATAWDSGVNSISATINQGSFADGASAYVFVIDENGIPSTGYQITFATSSDVVAPSAPSGLSVQ